MHQARPSAHMWARRCGVITSVAILAATAVFLTGSCLFSSGTNVCKNGLRCAPGLVCDVAEDACIEPDGCGNGIVSPEKGEVCDDGNTKDGDGCSADCKSN